MEKTICKLLIKQDKIVFIFTFDFYLDITIDTNRNGKMIDVIHKVNIFINVSGFDWTKIQIVLLIYQINHLVLNLKLTRNFNI